MKRSLILFFALLLTRIASAQTATDFTANDCNGNPHNLFNELNAGKVIVLCWVMPCSNCTGPAQTTHNVVQSFQASNPNKVFMYLADDYANTNCASLSSWATSNSLTNATLFSSAAINMNHYGTAGMPKVVVLGGTTHSVYYNANNTVNQTSLQNAITAAIAANASGIAEESEVLSALGITPNPSVNKSTITFTLNRSSEVTAEIYNHVGQKIAVAFNGALSAGEKQIDLDTNSLSKGLYFVNLKVAGTSKMIKLLVAHQN